MNFLNVSNKTTTTNMDLESLESQNQRSQPLTNTSHEQQLNRSHAHNSFIVHLNVP